MNRFGLTVLLVLSSLFSKAQILENDTCANAIELNVGYFPEDYVLTATTIECTASGLAPTPTCSEFGEGQDVWFSFHVPESGTCTVETFDNGGINDTVISIYEGNCDALVEVVCDDDAGEEYMSKAIVSDRTPGELLYIRLFEYQNNNFGSFDISVYDSNSQPPNNLPADAIMISCGTSVSGNTTNATETEDIEDCDEYPVSPSLVPDVWYKWMGDGSRVILSTCNTADFDTSIGVYLGDPETLYCVIANDDGMACEGYTSTLEFYSETDVLYYFRVYGYLVDSVGTFSLNMTCLDACAPPHTLVNAEYETSTTALLSWETANEESEWRIEYGKTNFTQGTGTLVTVFEPEVTITDLDEFYTYDYYIQSVCEDEHFSDWFGPVRWDQAAQTIVMYDGETNTCIPSMFTDSGGGTFNYHNGEESVFICYPSEEGSKMQVEFISFDCGDSLDYLEIYDGEDDSADLLVSSSVVGNEAMLTTYTATNDLGALTFLFDSDSETTYPGWTAKLSCTTPTSIETSNLEQLSAYPNPVKNILTIESDQIISRLELIDYSGRIILNKKVEEKQAILKLKHFDTGLYVIKLYTETGQSSFSITKL